MKNKNWLLKLGLVILCAAVLLGPADRLCGDDGFYVIPVTSMTFKGDWDVSTVYNSRDVVFFNGSSWFSLVGSNKGHAPDVSQNQWTMLAQKGDKGSPGPSQYKGEMTWTYHRTENWAGSVNETYNIKGAISFVGGSYYTVQGRLDIPGEKPLIISGSAILEGNYLMLTMHGSEPFTNGTNQTMILYANVNKTTFNGTIWANISFFNTLNRGMSYDYSAGTLTLTSTPIPLTASTAP